MCDTTMKMTTLSLTMLFVMKRYFRSLQNVICQLPLLALSVSCNVIRLRMVHRHMQYLRRAPAAAATADTGSVTGHATREVGRKSHHCIFLVLQASRADCSTAHKTFCVSSAIFGQCAFGLPPWAILREQSVKSSHILVS